MFRFYYIRKCLTTGSKVKCSVIAVNKNVFLELLDSWNRQGSSWKYYAFHLQPYLIKFDYVDSILNYKAELAYNSLNNYDYIVEK